MGGVFTNTVPDEGAPLGAPSADAINGAIVLVPELVALLEIPGFQSRGQAISSAWSRRPRGCRPSFHLTNTLSKDSSMSEIAKDTCLESKEASSNSRGARLQIRWQSDFVASSCCGSSKKGLRM